MILFHIRSLLVFGLLWWCPQNSCASHQALLQKLQPFYSMPDIAGPGAGDGAEERTPRLGAVGAECAGGVILCAPARAAHSAQPARPAACPSAGT